jgi:uncharacterized repeat protein (TIGR02543 family)
MKTILSWRRDHYLAKFSIFLIMVALIAGMIGCEVHEVYYPTMAASPPEGGTATDETGASPYDEGDPVNISAEAAYGYKFVGWTAPAGTFANPNNATTIFTMPAQDVTITANFLGPAGYWPMFHCDSQRTGFCGSGIDVTDGNLQWTFPVQSSPASNGVPSSPVVGPDGTIYVGSMGSDPKLFAINPNGTRRWSFDTGDWGKISTSPAISPDSTKVYVFTHASSGAQDNYFAINTTTGAQIWSGMLPNNDWIGMSNPAVINEGRIPIIYVCGSNFDIDGHDGKYALYRIDGNTGIIDPNFPIYLPVIVVTAYGDGSPSPAVANDGTIYCSGGNKLYAINPDGSIKWSCNVSTANAEHAMFLAINEQGGQERIYIGTTEHQMCAVQENVEQDGASVDWSHMFNASELATVPAIADLNADGNVEVVFAGTSLRGAHVYAITDLGGSNYEVFWTSPPLSPTLSSVAVGRLPVGPPNDCRVFIGDALGNIHTLAGWNGTRLAVYDTGGALGTLTSSPAVRPSLPGWLGAPGWVFATANNATDDGLLYAFGTPGV